MKNAKNIQKITTSLFLAVTLVLGSVSFAVPGIMPSAFAATENLVVSADNNLFDKSFNGPMVIEVVVNDNDIDEIADLEPDVTLNGGNLKMIQAGDGNWYAYIVQNQSSYGQNDLFVNNNGLTTAPFTTDDTDAVEIYINADVVVRQPKETSNNDANTGVTTNTLWPVIQAFDFAVDGSVTITYAKGGNPQSIALTFLDDPDDYASLSLDRSSYPAGADVHMTITSLAHNIDPTDEDSWTYDLTSDTVTVTYQQFNENGVGDSNTGVELDLADLNFDDSGLLDIITNPNNASVDIIQFQNNADQNKSDDASAFVTILETQPNSGIFKNTDDGDTANIYINSEAPRGYTAVIDYADSPLSVPVRNYPGSLAMDVSGIGGTWNGGEEITVTLDDGDLNLNSLVDEDISLTNWAQKIPTVITGSPLTLEDAFNIMAEGTPVNISTIDIDTFSKRASIPGNAGDNVTAMYTLEDIHPDLFYFSNTLEGGLKELSINKSAASIQNVTVCYTFTVCVQIVYSNSILVCEVCWDYNGNFIVNGCKSVVCCAFANIELV